MTAHPLTRDDVSTEDLLVLLAAAEDDEERRQLTDAVVGRTLALADQLAAGYARRGVERDDLVQVARAALVGAVRRYRPGAVRGFAAYAVPTIRGGLRRYFRDAGWVVRPPRGVQELRAEATAAGEQLRHRLGRDASAAEIADAVGHPVPEVRDALAAGSAFAPSSLDAPTVWGGSLGDLIADPLDLADSVETRSAVRAEIARLTPRERRILTLRFVEERSQREIGEAIGVSQMQVSRLLASVLARLRDGLGQVTAA